MHPPRARVKMLTRRLKCFFSVVLAATVMSQAVIAQKGTHVTKRVSFQPGSNATVIKGKANWGTSYIYLLRALAGKTLTARVEVVPVLTIIPTGTRKYEPWPGADVVKE